MRLFVALDLPQSARQMLLSLQDNLEQLGMGGRRTREENLHLTLRFLGDVDERKAPVICQRVQRAVEEQVAPMVHINGVGAFVRATGDTVFAQLGGDLSGVHRLAAAVSKALQPMGVRAEMRPFRPHITLLRNARFGNQGIRTKSEPFFLSRVCVYASTLGAGPNGTPLYRALCEVVLPR